MPVPTIYLHSPRRDVVERGRKAAGRTRNIPLTISDAGRRPRPAAFWPTWLARDGHDKSVVPFVSQSAGPGAFDNGAGADHAATAARRLCR